MTHKEAVARYNKWVALKKKGATVQEIGDMYGISRQAVSERLKKGEPKNASGDERKGILALNGMGHLTGRNRSRMLVRIRDEFTCQDCGSMRLPEEVANHNKKKKTLVGRIKLYDVHHTHGQCGKNSRGYDSTVDISKMITLCHKCHYNRPEHRMKQKTLYKAGIVE